MKSDFWLKMHGAFKKNEQNIDCAVHLSHFESFTIQPVKDSSSQWPKGCLYDIIRAQGSFKVGSTEGGIGLMT